MSAQIDWRNPLVCSGLPQRCSMLDTNHKARLIAAVAIKFKQISVAAALAHALAGGLGNRRSVVEFRRGRRTPKLTAVRLSMGSHAGDREQDRGKGKNPQ